MYGSANVQAMGGQCSGLWPRGFWKPCRGQFRRCCQEFSLTAGTSVTCYRFTAKNFFQFPHLWACSSSLSVHVQRHALSSRLHVKMRGCQLKLHISYVFFFFLQLRQQDLQKKNLQPTGITGMCWNGKLIVTTYRNKQSRGENSKNNQNSSQARDFFLPVINTC